MKAILIFVLCLFGLTCSAQLNTLHHLASNATADSAYIVPIAHASTGYPSKSTVGTLFKNHTGYIYYKATNAVEADIPQGSWKIFKNTASDSIFLYINDSTTIYKVILSKVE